MSKTTSIIHPASGIDLTAPGGVAALLDFHRCHFGDAVMEDNGGAGTGGDGGNGGDSGAGGQQAGPSQNGTGQQGTGTSNPPANDGKDGDEPLGEGGKKALQAERDARTQAQKALTDAQNRIKELEDATKTDEQKRADRVQELESSDRQKDTTIAGLQADLMRFRVAAAEGLDLEAAERLRGTTEDEIRADAKAFATKFGSKRPGEVPGAGTRGSDTVQVSPGMGRLTHAYSTSSK